MVSLGESKAPTAHLHLALVVKRAAQAGRRAAREPQVFKRDEEGGREARVVGVEEAVCGGRVDNLERLKSDGNESGAVGVEDAAPAPLTDGLGIDEAAAAVDGIVAVACDCHRGLDGRQGGLHRGREHT